MGVSDGRPAQAATPEPDGTHQVRIYFKKKFKSSNQTQKNNISCNKVEVVNKGEVVFQNCSIAEQCRVIQYDSGKEVIN